MTRTAPPPAGFRAELSRLAAASRGTAGSRAGHLLLIACRLPGSADPLDLWGVAAPGELAAFWEHAGETLVGIGETPDPAPGDGIGDDTVAPVSARNASLPRRLGCVPFAPAWTDPDWRPLTELGFVLPRWTAHRRQPGEPIELTLAVRGPLPSSRVEELEAEFEAIRHAVERGRSRTDVEAGPATSRPAGRADPTPAAWKEAVESALREIGAGRLEKVVLARRVAEPLPAGRTAVDLLRALRAEGSGPFRFGLRRAGRTFLGTSPECLFSKSGDEVEVEALAGTYDLEAGLDGAPARDLVGAAEHLFASGKDLGEHALVVRGVVEALEPLATSVAPDEWPRVRRARGLAHLSTTVRARVRPGVTPGRLIDALHPTPAVGGLPRTAAVEFIRRTESAPRGLFAAPVGWIGPEGDACLAVGIRSALVLDTHAWVYAGAGIVAASEAAAEWDETAAKLRWFRELVDAAAGGASRAGAT